MISCSLRGGQHFPEEHIIFSIFWVESFTYVIRQHLPFQPLKRRLYVIFPEKLVSSPKTRCHNTKEDNLKNRLLENLKNFIGVTCGEEDLPTSTLNLKAVYPPSPNFRNCLEEYAI